MMNKLSNKALGFIVLAVLLVIISVVILFNNKKINKQTTTIYGAVGGGKENFLADEEFTEILEYEYDLDVVNDTWSNGKTVKEDLKRENGDKYDFVFFSDQRFYDYFKTPATGDEAPRDTVLNGSLTLNTPIVIYSWDVVVDALIKENIVTKTDDVYYITDMNKLLDYILNGKKWSDIGLNNLYGNINIDSTDPVTSSPGATYYGLLLSIMAGGTINDKNVDENLPKLKEFYEKSGYMNNTPADLFEMYLKTGVGAKPMIVDYEKSIIDFANSNPDGYKQIKDKIRILYPTPTIWNSHCIATFTENGNKYLNVFKNTDVQNIAWKKYGFRTGTTVGSYKVSDAKVDGLPQNIDKTVSGLRMNVYNKLIDYLKEEQ